MPSPFPGMNPYLEQEDVWQDFHQSFIPLLREALSPQVLPAYIVKVEEHLFIHELPAQERRLLGRADVSMTTGSGVTVAARSETRSAEAPAHGRVNVAVDIERHSYLEIRDRRSRELVTVIELLSPTNKRPGPDREQYLAKRRQILVSNTHLVEIDLLRAGPRMPVEDALACDYCILVSQVEDRPNVGLWPLQLRDILPSIPIPLRAPDPPVWLDLQKPLHELYDAAGYAHYIYDGMPQPPLTGDDETWARSLLDRLGDNDGDVAGR